MVPENHVLPPQILGPDSQAINNYWSATGGVRTPIALHHGHERKKMSHLHLEAVAWTSLVPVRIADWVRNKYHYMTEKWAELELSVWCVRKKGFMGFCSKNVLKSAWFYTSRQTLVIFLSYLFFFVIFKPSQTLAQPVPDLCTSFSKMTAKKIKKPLTSFMIHLLYKKRFLTDAKARCKGVWLLQSTICN